MFRGEYQPVYLALPVEPSPAGWRIFSQRSMRTYYEGKSPHVARLMFNIIGQRLVSKDEKYE